MNQLARLSALCAALAASACAVDSTSEPVIDLGEADDRLSDFDFAPVVSEVRPVDAMSIEAELNVASAEAGDGLVVTGPLYTIALPAEGSMEVRVTTASLLDWVTDDLQFMMLVQNDLGAWTPMPLFVEYERKGVPTLSRLESFDRITYAVEGDMIVAENGAIGEFEISRSGISSHQEIGIFAIPVSTWGDLRGDYSFKLESSCNDALCRTPDPETAPDPDAPEGPVGPDDPETDPGTGGGQPRTSVRLRADADATSMQRR